MPIVNNEGHQQIVKYQELDDATLATTANRLIKIFLNGFVPRLSAFYQSSYSVKDPSVDLTALQEVIIRVDKRKEHARIFHNITDSAEYRVAALYCYWIIKLHPFSIDATKRISADKIYMDSSVNEHFALFYLINTIKLMYKSGGRSVSLDEKYLEELIYTFRYRDLNKASMIMLLEPRFKNL